jgi:solute carrier family 25 iron transporter 28/37
MHCVAYTLRTEGIRAFYLSYPATLAASIPFQSIHFAAYESIRHYLLSTTSPLLMAAGFGSRNQLQADGTSIQGYAPLTHITAGAIAGAIASGATTPLDVVKTLLQTRTLSACPEIRQCNSTTDAIEIIWRREGVWGFFRGARARMIAHMPATAISWGVYEYFKWVLKRLDKNAVVYGQHDVRMAEPEPLPAQA